MPKTSTFGLFGSTKEALFRQDLYHTAWNHVSAKMKRLQKSVFDEALQNVMDFCLKQSVDEPANLLLPTCAFVAGVNLPDHDDLFKLLSKCLKKSVTNHVAMVRSTDCNSLKILVKKIVLQLFKVMYFLHSHIFENWAFFI